MIDIKRSPSVTTARIYCDGCGTRGASFIGPRLDDPDRLGEILCRWAAERGWRFPPRSDGVHRTADDLCPACSAARM